MTAVLKIREIISFLCLMLSDITALFLSFFIAYSLRIQVIPSIFPNITPQALSFGTHLRYSFYYGSMIVIFVFIYEKLYTKRLSFWDETRLLLKGTILSFILLMMIVFVSRGYTQYSRPVIILAGFLSLFLFPLFRLAVKRFLVLLNIWKKRILILGTNQAARSVELGIRMNPTLGYEIVGFLAEHKTPTEKTTINNIKILGNIGQVREICNQYRVQDIAIVLPDYDQNKLRKLVESCETGIEAIRIVPNLGDLFSMGVEIESLGDVLSLSVARNLIKPWNLFIKRVLEFVLTLLLLVILSPILGIISMAIKINSPGPIIFTQKRLGHKNKTFYFYKFRSMFVDADLILEGFLKDNSMAKEEWKKYKKIKQNDPRVTRIGRLIRKYSLDELPQLINVLKGDMSLVGPRPYMPLEKNDIGKSYPIITRVKPGITGLWQVRGRNILPFQERLLLDEYYIRNWSLWLDMVILIKTIKASFSRKGAF